MRAPALVSACVLALLGGPGPACGATRCETPLPGGVVRSTATGLARAEEKFNEVVAGPVPAAHPARPASAPPRATSMAGSRLKRPSDVSSIMHQGQGGGASVSAARCLSTGPPAAPTASTRHTGGTMLSSARAEWKARQQDDGDLMLESPTSVSSTRSDTAGHSLSVQATPACFSQRHRSTFAPLSKSEFMSGVETPHLRASEWAEASPDSTRRRRPLSQKLFASDDLQQGAGPGESQSAVKLLSAMKEQQQQQLGLPLEDQQIELDEEAYMLLGSAREELQALNQRWKDAEEARTHEAKKAAELRGELDGMQEDLDILEAEKVAIYGELQSAKTRARGLQEDVHAAQQQHREAVQRCSVLMSEKAAVEAQLAALESKTLQDKQIALQADSVADGLGQKLQAVGEQLASAQDERQKLWAHIADLQVAASDAEQIQAGQRQQLTALCNALEASEVEREQLQAKAMRADHRLGALLANMNGTESAVARAVQSEREMEELVAQAKCEAQQARLELDTWSTKCQAFEVQLETFGRDNGQAHAVNDVKAHIEQHVEKVLRTQQNSVQAAEDEVKAWRVKAQELESQLLSAQMAASDRDELEREVQTRLQQQVELQLRQVEERKADEVKKVSSQAQEEFARKASEWEAALAEAQAEVKAALATLDDKEREKSELENKVLDAQTALDDVQQQLTGAQQQHQEQTMQMVQLNETNARGQAAYEEQQQDLQALRARAVELEVRCAELEQHKLDSMGALATQEENLKGSEALKEQLELLRIELAGVAEEKASLERDMQARFSSAQDFEAKLDAAAAESAAMMRRCEELRVAFEAAAQGRDGLKLELSQVQDQVNAKEEEAQALRERVRELEENSQQHSSLAEEQSKKILELEERCNKAREGEEEAARKCKEAEKVARDATRSASKELYLVQAQVSHLRQQVDSLTKDKESVIQERDAALQDKQMLYMTNKQHEDEVARLMQEMRALSVGAMAGAAGTATVGDGAGAAGAGAAVGAGGDILQSVMAQRTRRRTLLDSVSRPAPAEAVRGHDDGGDLADDVDAGAETMRSGVGERTRCRTAQGQKASDNTAYLLRHIPVPGVQSAVDIPDTVQLLHTGFVIGRVGADLSLTSGYVSRKHAQLQRTVCGPCGPISVVHACRVMIVFPARCRWLGNATEALSVSINGAQTR